MKKYSLFSRLILVLLFPLMSHTRHYNAPQYGALRYIMPNKSFNKFATLAAVDTVKINLNTTFFRDNQSPNRLDSITNRQIIEYLDAIRPFIGSQIRTFGCRFGNQNVPLLAKERGLSIIITPWLNGNKTDNEKEINNAIALANAGLADTICVGSEVLLRRNLTVAELLQYIRRVKAAVPAYVKVTTADVYSELINAPDIRNECSFLFTNIYPFWEGVPINCAIYRFNQAYESLKTVANGKEILISESGWPDKGNPIGEAVPSTQNAQIYLQDLLGWCKVKSVKTFVFASHNEAWKTVEGSVGPNWGLWTSDNVIKPWAREVLLGLKPLKTTGFNCNFIPSPNGDTLFVVTQMPILGNNELNLKGQLTGVKPCDFHIVTYIKVGNGWWIKPFASPPTVQVNCDGSFSIDITTGGIDYSATDICIFLLPKNYTPPVVLGGSLPLEVSQKSVRKICITRTATPLSATITATSNTVCEGSFSILKCVSINAKTYQWQYYETNIVGATDSILQVYKEGQYRLIVTDSYGSTHSNTLTLGASKKPDNTITASDTLMCLGNSISLNAKLDQSFTYQWQVDGTNIAGATKNFFFAEKAGIYTCVITNVCGSVTTKPITIYVLNRPNLIIIASDTLICLNKLIPITFSVPYSPFTTYQWLDEGRHIIGANTYTFVISKPAKISLLSTNKCGGGFSNIISVKADSLPKIQIIKERRGDSTILSVPFNPNWKYYWDFNGGVILGANSATYTTIANAGFRCLVSTPCGVVLSNTITATVDPVKQAFQFKAYPNPNTEGGVLQLDFNSPSNILAQIILTDVSGKTIFHNSYRCLSEANHLTIPLPQVKGFYLLNCHFGEFGVISEKIVIQ